MSRGSHNSHSEDGNGSVRPRTGSTRGPPPYDVNYAAALRVAIHEFQMLKYAQLMICLDTAENRAHILRSMAAYNSQLQTYLDGLAPTVPKISTHAVRARSSGPPRDLSTLDFKRDADVIMLLHPVIKKNLVGHVQLVLVEFQRQLESELHSPCQDLALIEKLMLEVCTLEQTVSELVTCIETISRYKQDHPELPQVTIADLRAHMLCHW